MTQGGRELRGALVAGRVLPAGVPVHRHWFEIIPRVLSLLVRQLYPPVLNHLQGFIVGAFNP